MRKTSYRGVEQLVARQAHNLEVVRSSRASATTKASIILIGAFLFYLPIQLPPFYLPYCLNTLNTLEKATLETGKTHLAHSKKICAKG